MSCIFHLERADACNIDFEFKDGKLVAKRTSIPNFPFTNAVLLRVNHQDYSINPAAASAAAKIELLRMEIMCSPKWPVALEFAEQSGGRDEEEDLSKRARVASTFSTSASKGERADSSDTGSDGEEDNNEGQEDAAEHILFWNFASLPHDSCSLYEVSQLASGGAMDVPIMKKFLNFVIYKGQGEYHAQSIFNPRKQEQQEQQRDKTRKSAPTLLCTLGQKKGMMTAYHVLLYQEDGEQQGPRGIHRRWELALLAVDKDGNFAVANTSVNAGPTYEALLANVSRAPALARSKPLLHVSLTHVMTGVSDEDSGFAVLELCSRIAKLKVFKTVHQLKNVMGKHGAPGTQVLDKLRAKFCEVLRRKNSQTAAATTPSLPPLPFDFPSDDAVYRELWNLFVACGETEFVTTYLREVPNGINLNYKYSKCKTTPVAERRRIVWEECRDYLQTKFKF